MLTKSTWCIKNVNAMKVGVIKSFSLVIDDLKIIAVTNVGIF